MAVNNHWTVEYIPDQSGKVALITGGNSGIGFETARELVKSRAQVVIACRSMERGGQAASKIKDESPQADIRVMELDLAALDSVHRFAELFRSQYDRLDMLINNAGVMGTPYQKTADGFELQLGVNHLGHFALTGRLIELLVSTPGARVVTISSFAHFYGWINFNNLNGEKRYWRWAAYCQSKLANLLFAYELQRKLEAAGTDTISVGAHPGYSATNLQNDTGFRYINAFVAQSQEMGALPVLYAATAEQVEGGKYYGPDGYFGLHGYPKQVQSSRASRNPQTASKLWQVSKELTGVEYNAL